MHPSNEGFMINPVAHEVQEVDEVQDKQFDIEDEQDIQFPLS